MSSAKLVVVSLIAALAVSACGTSAKPPAGTPAASKGPGKIDDPRTTKPNHVACLRNDHFQVVEIGATDLQVGTPGVGPFVHFADTSGVAQGDQMSGDPQYQGAEVIGSALLYPKQASDSQLKMIETCLAQGVTG
jgi:hypothetical protein